MRRHSPYNYAFDNPFRFIDPDGMGPEDVITTISNSKVESPGLYETRDINIKITLTVVNQTGSNLSSTMFNKNSGTYNATSVFGGDATAKLAGKDVDMNIKSVIIDYVVVNNIDDARKGDNILVIANNIPETENQTEEGDPVGLANRSGGNAMAIEANSIKNKTFNKVVLHEIGHSAFSLDDNYGTRGDGTGLMGYANNGSTTLTDKQKAKVGISVGGFALSNGTYSRNASVSGKVDTKQETKDFLKKNNIK